MTSNRKKPGMAFWAIAVVVVALVLYPLSFGPACWWFSNPEPHSRGFAPRIFWPMGWVATNGPEPCRRAIRWYALLAIDGVDLPTDLNGSWTPIFRGPRGN